MNILAAIMILSNGGQLDSRIGATNEAAILLNVAREYSLTPEQTKLLVVIRRCENGSPDQGVELGVSVKAAQRYAGMPVLSLECQARWCAGSIKKRYTGDIGAFAESWCPVNSVTWAKMVKGYMDRKEA